MLTRIGFTAFEDVLVSALLLENYFTCNNIVHELQGLVIYLLQDIFSGCPQKNHNLSFICVISFWCIFTLYSSTEYAAGSKLSSKYVISNKVTAWNGNRE